MTRPTTPTPGDTDWFAHDRFGLFIHWGLYALGARHEWLKHNEELEDADYDRRYFDHFEPDLYDPEAWAAAAAQAGMKYFVVTTKHHDGFCLWDSALTDYKAPNTPAGRDLLRPMVEAFQIHGLRTGFYHSLIDWHHPDYLIDPHIGNNRNRDRAALNQGRDQQRYADHLHCQVRELLTGYGEVDILWFDFSYPGRGPEGKGRADWRSEELIALIRELRPEIILNDRLDLPDGWDVKTPEQYQPQDWVQVDGKPVVWEACQTLSGSWGYHRDEASWRSTENLVQTLIDCVSKGGNLLLNVGPTGRGEIDARALERLRGIGAWMRRHSRSIYGCTEAPESYAAACPRDCRLTWHPQKKRLYVHIFAWPYKHLRLPGLAGQAVYAQLLHDASEVPMRGIEAWQGSESGDDLVITLPQRRPEEVVPVIELFMA
ncbi:MAG: alpha-L-fucosidase [Planctomycetota bacterium]